MIQRIRLPGAVAILLLGSILLSACGAVPVAEYWPGLTIAGDTLYAISGSPQQVYLLDAETGQQKASFLPQGQPRGVLYWSPVTVGGDLAYVGFSDPAAKLYGLYAFDPATGLEQWHIPVQALILPAPTYAEGVVYVGSDDGRVYAIDLVSRSVKPGWPFQAKQAIWASPILAGDRLFVASMDHRLYCLNAQTGEKVWEFEAQGALAAQPVLDAETGIVYVGGLDARLYAVDAESGQAVEGFQFKADNWIWSEVLLAGDLLYVTSLDGRLYALDPATGAVQPPYPFDSGQLGGQDDAIRAAPAQAGESVVIATRTGYVVAVADGIRQWSWPGGLPQSQVLTTPVVVGNRVYVILTNGQVQTLQADNGVMGWGFAPPASQ